MHRIRCFVINIGLLLFLQSCSQPEPAIVEGHMDYVGSSEIYIEKQPIHYKYAPVQTYPVEPDDRGHFHLRIPVDSTEIVQFIIDDNAYPVVVEPDHRYELAIHRARFPDSVSVRGYRQPWDEFYYTYKTEEKKIQASIEEELPAFRKGEPNDLLELYKNRIMAAKRYLGDTPLDIYYHKAIGEYLVRRLDRIRYRRNTPGFDPQKERKAVLEKAKKMNFFRYDVLKDQRAGIRDFTNAYANTFGVEDSLEALYGQDLMQYDVKRLGYETLDSARTSVLEHIEGRKALAYAKMYLIAERIGEMSPSVAESSYNAYLDEFGETYPQFAAFLKSFYKQRKRVSPGQPAIDFSLPNRDGEIVRMDDFLGKYVLLDFWAAWCIPCLDEFPHMRTLYRKYNREDFEIVAISLEEDSLTWRRALNRFDNPWIQLYGGDEFDQPTFKTYRGGGIPFYILVNRKGNIERYNDIRPSFNLEEVLDSLLARENYP